jgi:hypothetical protein
MKFGRQHLWKILYRNCSFHFDPLTFLVVGVLSFLEEVVSHQLKITKTSLTRGSVG